MTRIGIDVGGTFTDLVATDEGGGAARHFKLLSIPDNPCRRHRHEWRNGCIVGLTQESTRERSLRGSCFSTRTASRSGEEKRAAIAVGELVLGTPAQMAKRYGVQQWDSSRESRNRQEIHRYDRSRDSLSRSRSRRDRFQSRRWRGRPFLLGRILRLN
jgi:hypothetical protein